MTRFKRCGSRLISFASFIAHHDLTMIICVMLLVRVLAIVALRVGGYIDETGPDTAYYFDWGRLSAGGAYPAVNYWLEYPPLFPWISVLAYKLAVLVPSWIDQRFWFNLVLHFLIVPFDAANAVLIYALARRISDQATAIKSAWLYATLFVPLYIALGWFESLALFAVLFAIRAILSNRSVLAGISIGLGILIKPYVAIVGAIGLMQLRPIKRIVPLVISGLFTLIIGLSPFILANPPMLKATLDSITTRPGWSSPYALIDGLYSHIAIKVADRFDPTLAAQSAANSRVPWTAVTLVIGTIYLAALIRSFSRRTPRTAFGLAGFTFIMFLLWSKGYSPQWSLYAIAILCILTPDLFGVLLLMILEALYVLEWPITFVLLNGDQGYLTGLIVIRTLLFVGLAILFAAEIFFEPNSRRWQRTRMWVKIEGAGLMVATIGLAISALPVYAAQRYQQEPLQPAVTLIQTNSQPNRANILFDQPATYERLAAFLPNWSTLSALQYGGGVDAWSNDQVQAFAQQRPELWYVLDYGASQNRDSQVSIDRMLTHVLCKISTQFAGSAQVSLYANAQPSQAVNLSVGFQDGLQLDGARISGTSLRASDPVCVELHWSTTQKISSEYTVFLHLLDANGQLIAQSDLQLDGNYAPTDGWQPNTLIIDRHGLILPAALPVGIYRLAIGLYDANGTRLKNDATTSPEPDSVLLAEFTVQ